jgi:hypothetical protein
MIGSLLSRISDAEKLTPQQLQQTVKNKVLPAGIASMISQDYATKQASAPIQPPQGTVVSKIMEEADKVLSPEDKIMQKINLIKQDIGEIQEGVQSGEIKAYEGIPIIKEKVAELGKLQAMLQPPPQIPQMPPSQQMAPPQQMPPMQQTPQGIDSAESNLPTEMAKGGIVGFADGGFTGNDNLSGGNTYTAAGNNFGGGGGGNAPLGGPQGQLGSNQLGNPQQLPPLSGPLGGFSQQQPFGQPFGQPQQPQQPQPFGQPQQPFNPLGSLQQQRQNQRQQMQQQRQDQRQQQRQIMQSLPKEQRQDYRQQMQQQRQQQPFMGQPPSQLGQLGNPQQPGQLGNPLQSFNVQSLMDMIRGQQPGQPGQLGNPQQYEHTMGQPPGQLGQLGGQFGLNGQFGQPQQPQPINENPYRQQMEAKYKGQLGYPQQPTAQLLGPTQSPFAGGSDSTNSTTSANMGNPQQAQPFGQLGNQQQPISGFGNLQQQPPINNANFASGGIVGYARGSIIDDEDDDIDPTEDFRTASKMFARDPMEQRRESVSILGMGDSIRPMMSSFTQPISDFASSIKNKFINKTPEVDTVTKPQGQIEGGIPGIIASKAQKYNLPPQLMSSIAKAESNFNPNAGNKTGSSAKGLYQFIDKTWMGMGGKPGEQFDPEINSELGAKYIRQNAEFLKNRLGRDPSYSEVYAAHYFGPSGASNLLTRANPKDSIEKGLGTFNDPKGVKLIMKQNPNLRGKTVGQVLNDLETKTGSGIVSLAQGGQIKHFIKGGMLFDDFMGGAPYEEFNRPNAITPEEIRKNQAAQKAAERARNAARIGPPKPLVGPTAPVNPAGIASSPKISPKLASRLYGSTIGRIPAVAAGAATVAGLDALTSTDTGTASDELDPIAAMQATQGGYNRQDENRFKSITDRLFPQGFSAPAVVKPEVNSEVKPAAKPVVKPNVNPVIDSRESDNARALIESGKNDQARRDALFADYGDTSFNEDAELGANITQQNPNILSQPATTKVEEKSAFDKFLEGLEAKRGEIKGKKDEDKYMSLLAAGLGMMSGTSQFAAANIGKGALAGVQDYRDTQKQRAAELAAVDKEIGSGLYRKTVGDYYGSQILSKDEKAKRDQAALDEKVQNNAATQYRFINEQIDNQVKNEMASLQKSLGGTIMTPEQIALKSDEIRRRLEQKNSPLINTLLKRMNMPTIDLGTNPTGNKTIDFKDIK